jgi:hypothetical protein
MNFPAKYVRDFNDLEKKQTPIWAKVTEALNKKGLIGTSSKFMQKFIYLRNQFKKQ